MFCAGDQSQGLVHVILRSFSRLSSSMMQKPLVWIHLQEVGDFGKWQSYPINTRTSFIGSLIELLNLRHFGRSYNDANYLMDFRTT